MPALNLHRSMSRRIRLFADLLLSLWWISWFGILGPFLWLGGWSFKIQISNGSPTRLPAVILLVVPLLWISFFVADSKVEDRNLRAMMLLTITGTLLAVLSLAGIWYFVSVAPRVH